MDIDFDKIKLIRAKKENEFHKKGVWKVFNENIEFFHFTSKTVPFEEHCNWWIDNFDKEYIYIIMYKSKISGYIRLTKERTNNKEKNEISIALLKVFQKCGIGSYAYHLFENEMKHFRITEIVANSEVENVSGQKFFEKNGFKKILITFKKII